MGANHARLVAASPRCRLVHVSDPELAAAQRVASLYGAKASRELPDAKGFDVAIVASPTDTHLAVGGCLLSRGIPTLVEKPLATTLTDVAELLAAGSGTPLMCGFVERFNPVVATAKQFLEDSIVHIRTQRQSPPPGRYSSNAIWDLLIHDLDLVLGCFPKVEARTVVAVGLRDAKTGSLESVEASFEIGSAVASTMCSRVWQRKVRAVQIATTSALLELDLMRQTLTIYRSISHELYVHGTSTYRSATTVDVPFVAHAGEPLALELEHFLDLARGDADAGSERASILPPHTMAQAIEQLCA